MFCKKPFIIGVLALLAGSTSLPAGLSEREEGKIKWDLSHKRHKQLGVFLKEGVSHSSHSLAEIRDIAKEKHSESLLRAVNATERYRKIRKGRGFTMGAFLQTALFIEHDLLRAPPHKIHYFKKRKTGLTRPLEYDPRHKSTFIVLDGIKSQYLGEGARKTAYKSIFYNRGKPQVCARAEQRGGMKKEFRLLKKLQGAPGIMVVEGFGKRKKHGKKYTTVYAKLYNASDLKVAFENNEKFSLYEKLRIARGAIRGLESLHRKRIIHRDIAAQNIFLNIPEGKKGKRAIEAVIADFGWSNFSKYVKHKKAQASLVHTAPEGIYFEELKKKHYYTTDVYALGLVFYNLIYEKKGSWKGIKTHSTKHYYKKLRRNLKHEIKRRRDELRGKRATPSKEFKLLVLRMISPKPHKRGTASELRAKIEQIFNKVK